MDLKARRENKNIYRYSSKYIQTETHVVIGKQIQQNILGKGQTHIKYKNKDKINIYTHRGPHPQTQT
jgi:ribosomal protein L31E